MHKSSRSRGEISMPVTCVVAILRSIFCFSYYSFRYRRREQFSGLGEKVQVTVKLNYFLSAWLNRLEWFVEIMGGRKSSWNQYNVWMSSSLYFFTEPQSAWNSITFLVFFFCFVIFIPTKFINSTTTFFFQKDFFWKWFFEWKFFSSPLPKSSCITISRNVLTTKRNLRFVVPSGEEMEDVFGVLHVFALALGALWLFK